MNLGERDAHAKWLDVVAVMHGLLCDFSEDLKEVTDQRDRLYREKPTADVDTSVDPEEHNILRMTVDIMKARQTQACEIVTAAIGDGPGHVEKRVQQLADALTAERAKVAELQHALETANAAAARRAEESQLEPVGFAWRRRSSLSLEVDKTFKGDNVGGVGAYYMLDGHVNCGTTYRIYIQPINNEGGAA